MAGHKRRFGIKPQRVRLQPRQSLPSTRRTRCFKVGAWIKECTRGARCSSVVRAFAHGAMGRRVDPSWGGPIELFLVPASAPRLV